MAGIKMMAN